MLVANDEGQGIVDHSVVVMVPCLGLSRENGYCSQRTGRRDPERLSFSQAVQLFQGVLTEALRTGFFLKSFGQNDIVRIASSDPLTGDVLPVTAKENLWPPGVKADWYSEDDLST